MKKKSIATEPPRCAHCTGPIGCQGPCGDILHCDEAAIQIVLKKKRFGKDAKNTPPSP